MPDKNDISALSRGLQKDAQFQQHEDVTFALNCIRDNHEGGKRIYQSEPGNNNVAILPSGYSLCGTINGQDDEIYLFSTNGVDSEIGIYKHGVYSDIANLNLGFSWEHPITGEFRVKNGCEKIIYWCDGYNPDYYFNTSKPDDFKTGGVFDPNKFRFIPKTTVPDINLIEVRNYGGHLKVGSYYFQIEVLDKQQNIIYRSDITPQTVIYHDSQSSSYIDIDGALNAPQFDPTIGGVLETNKSIELQFSNLDTTAAYIRVFAIEQSTSNTVVTAHAVGGLLPINSSTVNYIYSGYNPSAGDYPVDYSSLIIPLVKYESSYVIDQVQDRLVRGNLKVKDRDYSLYQAAASNITVRWVAEECEAENSAYLGNPKNPKTYWYKTSFQGDEIYDLGVQYLHDDGEWSPVFHIPGMKSDSYHQQLLTVIDNLGSLGATDVFLSDVEHLGLNIGDSIPRWKVHNTATLTDSNTGSHPYSYAGAMSYYEANFEYPDIRDCNGNFIWGTNIQPGDKVRFHQMPDRNIIPHVAGSINEYILPIGLEFTVPSYPAPDIIGHRFVHAVRDDYNRTVVDAGYVAGAQKNTDVNGDYYLDFSGRLENNSYEYVYYESPEILYNSNLKQATYYKVNRIHQVESNSIANLGAAVSYTSVNSNTVYSGIYTCQSRQDSAPIRSNYKINDQLFCSPGSRTPEVVLGIPVEMYDYFTPISVIKSSYKIEDFDSILPLANTPGSLMPFASLPGRYCQNNGYAYKKNVNEVYVNFLEMNHKYISLNPTYGTGVSTHYGGDVILSNMINMRQGLYTAYRINDGDNTDNVFEYFYNNYRWVESPLNSDLRVEGLDYPFLYWRYGDSDLDALEHSWKILEGPPLRLEIRPWNEWIPEYYRLNSDYDVQTKETGKFKLPKSHNYCQDCSNLFPNRIVFSPKSFTEDILDLYRVTNANDYIEIPAHKGEITGIRYQNNKLLVHTSDSTFVLQPYPQQISTDQNSAYLSTGDFLSIPPQEINQVDIGFAGCQSKQSQCNTPYGYFWCDQKRGEIFSWENGIMNISSRGLEQWFKEYLPSDLKSEYYRVIGEEFPIKSTYARDGYGVLLYYDPRYKRLMVTKRDYLPFDIRVSYDANDYDHVLFSPVQGWSTYQDGNVIPVNYTNPRYFENKSWTISYDIQFKDWISWHSYIPYGYFADSSYFYTTTLSNIIWKHLHKERYQNYYNSKYDMIVETIDFNINTTSYNTIQYVGYAEMWDPQNKRFKNVEDTCNGLIVYNTDQSTGFQSLSLLDVINSPYDNNKILPDIKNVIKTDNNYKISGIYDMSIGQPVMTEDWQLRKNYFGYIDIVPNEGMIDFSKSQYDWGNMWDKFYYIRLFSHHEQDIRMSIVVQSSNKQVSIR